MTEELTVEEFRRRFGRRPTLPRPDPKWTVFLRGLCDSCLKRGWDLPTKEYRFDLPERAFRFDLAWPRLKVAFEREGGTWTGEVSHASGAGIARDVVKYNRAALKGWLVIRATSDMLADGSALETILKALALRLSQVGAPV